MTWSMLARFALAASLPILAVACVVDSTAPYTASSGGFAGGTGSGGTSAAAPGSDGGPSAHPILAPVDTDLTMTAAPGQGVGVFTEYATGGHWHIWWTCDTTRDSNPACAFDVKVSVQEGTIQNAVPQQFESGDLLTLPSASQVEATTTVSTGVDGLNFDTAPGATITLSATVGQQYNGQFIFFVEGGKVDDGFSGTVTDPIQLVGSRP